MAHWHTTGQLSSSICASMLPSRRKREFFSIELIEYDKKKFVLTNKFVAVPFKTPNRAMVVNTFWGVSCWPVRTKQDRAVRVVRTGYEMMKKSTADWREASFHTLWSSFLKKEKKKKVSLCCTVNSWRHRGLALAWRPIFQEVPVGARARILWSVLG